MLEEYCCRCCAKSTDFYIPSWDGAERHLEGHPFFLATENLFTEDVLLFQQQGSKVHAQDDHPIMAKGLLACEDLASA